MKSNKLYPSLLSNAVSYGRFTRPFITELVTFLSGKRVLEICAGNGYFASLLAEQGVTITPTSLFTGHDGHSERMYCPVEELDAEVAVDLHGDAHDVLLCSWPTTNNAMVRAATKWGTDRDIVFIGEFTDYTKGHLGGCATDDFFANINVISDFLSYEARLIERAIVVRWRDAAHTD